MIELDATFDPGRTLKNGEKVIINGDAYYFESRVRDVSLLKVIEAVFSNPNNQIIVSEYPYKGLTFSEEIDRDIYFDNVTGWKIREN